MISKFFLVVQKLNDTAKREGRTSTDTSELLDRHLAEERLERRKYLEAAVPAFLVALRKELETEASDINEKLYSHSDFIRVSGNQATLADLLITSNVANWFNTEICIEITSDISGELIETTRRPFGQASSQKELFLAGFGKDTRVATEQNSYNVQEYAYRLIGDFLKDRQRLREGSLE